MPSNSWWKLRRLPHPEEYVLGHIRWQFFGTLTFKGNPPPETHQLAMFHALMRGTAARYRIHFPKLPWALRREHGCRFGRLHFHFLLTSLPREVVHAGTARQLATEWLQLGGGEARVEVFNPALDGLGYLTKPSGALEIGNDHRESAKFGLRHCELMLSGGCQRILRSLSK